MGQELYGKPVAQSILKEVSSEIQQLTDQENRPSLLVILVSSDPASIHYAQSKRRTAERLGVAFSLMSLDDSTSEKQLIEFIQRANEDTSVHGILLELPLPKHISLPNVTGTIDPYKDIDGLRYLTGSSSKFGRLFPATPLAYLELVKYYGFEPARKHVVVVGRGKTVGMLLMQLLLRENATVTVCHSQTSDIGHHLRQADLAFIAVGRPGLVTREMVSERLVIIDAGINEDSSGCIIGDVASDVKEFVRAYSPTPGGVGPVTTAQIFANLMQARRLQLK